jgi:hypothetical protein
MSDHDDLESRFWGNCGSTFGEESKQRVYLREMGFVEHHVWHAGGFAWDAKGRSIIDIGGGPVSALLKMENLGLPSLVADPGAYPPWVQARYEAARIGYERVIGENLIVSGAFDHFDLALIYNCLQHCEDPAKVVANAITAAGVSGLRMFEWIDIEPHPGHPHMLTQAKLEEWTGRKGVVKEFQGENGCFGRAWILGGG